MLDSYSGGWAVLLVGALECISVGWFYGKIIFLQLKNSDSKKLTICINLKLRIQAYEERYFNYDRRGLDQTKDFLHLEALLDDHKSFVTLGKFQNIIIGYLLNDFIFITEIRIQAVVALSFRDINPLQSGKYTYPYWSLVLGQFITASTLSGVIFWAAGYIIYYVVKKKVKTKKTIIYFEIYNFK